MLPDTLVLFLKFMATPVFGAWVVSNFWEHNVWFQEKITSQMRANIVILTSVALGLASFALVRWIPQDILETLQPVYAIVVASIGAYVSGQIWHDKVHAAPIVTSESSVNTTVKTSAKGASTGDAATLTPPETTVNSKVTIPAPPKLTDDTAKLPPLIDPVPMPEKAELGEKG